LSTLRHVTLFPPDDATQNTLLYLTDTHIHHHAAGTRRLSPRHNRRQVRSEGYANRLKSGALGWPWRPRPASRAAILSGHAKDSCGSSRPSSQIQLLRGHHAVIGRGVRRMRGRHR
jgi:hypothetical protein